jgi:hypothetical protein
MPFKSKSQLGQCFSNEIKKKGHTSWNCEDWLSETPNPTCLPHRLGDPIPKSCRSLRKGEETVGPVYRGPRGGYYFFAKGVKVYIPKGQGNIKYAQEKWGAKKADLKSAFEN